MIDAAKFPHLFREWSWGPLRLQFELRDTPPPAPLIGNVNIIPYTEAGWVVLELQNGSIEIVGGTLEPEEQYLDTVKRELVEEAGATLLDFRLFGAFYCISSMPEPYRPHLPHPEFYRLVGYGKIELIGRPTVPAGGEAVVAVHCVSLDEAVQLFRQQNRHELTELYLLAAEIRTEHSQ